jgi:hypothetical protein
MEVCHTLCFIAQTRASLQLFLVVCKPASHSGQGLTEQQMCDVNDAENTIRLNSVVLCAFLP